MHLGASSLIALSCLAIGVGLLRVSRGPVRNNPFALVFRGLAALVLIAGMVHLLEASVPHGSGAWLATSLEVFTALAALAAAFVLPRVVPRVLDAAKNAAGSSGRGRKLEGAHRELRVLYARLTELEQLRAQLVANVSHELRTPLSLILSPAQKLLAQGTLAPEAARDVETIRQNALVLQRHVRDLLSVAKKESGELEPDYGAVDAAELVHKTCALFVPLAEERRLRFHVVAPARAPAELDVDKVERVLLNLLFNAFKLTPQGGVIRCQLDVTGDGRGLVIEVGDSGPGIAPSEREVVFQRFRRLDSGGALGGTGLGLTISRDFVELHGGRIVVGDAPEGGALFVVELPRLAPPGARVARGRSEPSREAVSVAEIAAAELLQESDGGVQAEASLAMEAPGRSPVTAENEPPRAKVLVVEDNRDLNRFLCRCLSLELDVVSAKNGAEGLALAGQERPDCILTDVMMPIMNGEALVRELRSREELESIPIIVLTARDDDQLRIKLLKEGVQDFITKPFLTDEVLARVRNLVAAKRAADVLSAELETKRMDLETMAREVTRHRHELQTTLAQMQVARDVAERASSVKSNFLRMMSHELRTPIAAMQLQLRLFEKHGSDELEPRQREYLARISRSAQRLLDLVNTVLEYARIESGRFEARVKPFSLGKVLREAIDDFATHAAQKGLRLALEPPDEGVPELASDPQVVRLVAVNLIGNAVKHTEVGEVVVGARFVDGVHELWVRDTGPGISKEHHVEVFEPFQRFEDIRQLQGAGSGLGLAIVRDMVRAVRGEIALESDVGKGATFVVRLPQLPESDEEQGKPASKAAAPPG